MFNPAPGLIAPKLCLPLNEQGKDTDLDMGLDALLDEPRPGAPRTLADDDVEKVITTTLETTPVDATQWITRSMAVQFRKFLDLIDTWVPHELDVHLILDNYGTHTMALIHRWLLKRPRFHLHFTPTSVSWLNLVGRWFAELTQKKIPRGSFGSTVQLEQVIITYLDTYNIDPRPFI